MSIYVRPFKKEDYLAIKNPIERWAKKYDLDFVQAIEESNLAVTGIKDGKVIGCGGVHPLLDKEQGELWLRLSKECLNYKLATLRWLREGMKIIEETYPFEQLFALIECDFKPSIRLVKFLGFHLIQTKTIENEKWLVFSKRVRECQEQK